MTSEFEKRSTTQTQEALKLAREALKRNCKGLENLERNAAVVYSGLSEMIEQTKQALAAIEQAEKDAPLDKLVQVQEDLGLYPDQAVKPGWWLVPVEPTPEMLKAAAKHDYENPTDPTWQGIYEAMLNAAPTYSQERGQK